MLRMKYECHTLTSSTDYARYKAVMTVAAINENSYFHSCKVQCASEGFYLFYKVYFLLYTYPG